MKLKFTKMHGCGNDYVYFNCFDKNIDNPEKLSVELSDRRFGIGGDGIILICPSNIADAKMRMFNLDGSEGKMCGNGIRCVGKFLYDNGIVRKDKITIETLSGIKTLLLHTQHGKATMLTVDMGKPEFNPSKVPVKLPGDIIVNRCVKIGKEDYNITCVSMGNPHCVLFLKDDVKNLNLNEIGPKFENAAIFPEKVNTEFVNVIDEKTLSMRVYERGSGETLACGTGACAAAVAAVLNGICKKDEDITVRLLGGSLKIKYTDETVFMTGPAKKVFEGEVEI